MKNKFTILLALIVACAMLFQACTVGTEGGRIIVTEKSGENSAKSDTTYMRGVWISQFELAADGEDERNAEGYTRKIDKIMSGCVQNGINTVFVQARPLSDAFYPSNFFPATKYLSGEQGVELDFDAFGIAVQSARSKGLSIHAWVNPFRVSSVTDFTQLSVDNPARKWYEEEPDTERLIICDAGIYYNPSNTDAQRLIIDGVCELMELYDIDGIHFDDYFYPTTEEAADAAQYMRYREQGGELTLAEWRREAVNCFVTGVYSAVKRIDEVAAFGISCSADMKKNQEVLYADVEKWCSEEGYIDYIMPQIYFGYINERMPFLTVLSEWGELPGDNEKTDLYCGLAAYKIGRTDEFAGMGKNEWAENTDMLLRQVTDVGKNDAYKGYCLFSFSYIFSDESGDIAQLELRNYHTVI